MEVAVAAGAEVGRVGRRIFQKIWDPEPTNDRSSNDPVWCLGRSYTLGEKAQAQASPPSLTASTPPADTTTDAATKEAAPIPAAGGNHQQQVLDTPPDSIASSFDSSLAYEDPSQDSGWPPAFLDDFESRIWMTYRNEFEMIPRSTDPKAASALSFAMRLKTSFGDQTGGFSSDTGWGCMIRSGQSLLANAILVSRLGRGMLSGLLTRWQPYANLSNYQIGEKPQTPTPSARYWHYLLTTPAPRTLCITSSGMEQLPVENTLESGSDRRLRHGAFSRSNRLGLPLHVVANTSRALANQHDGALRVYSTGDLPDVYEDSFMAVANPDGEHFHPTLILVCTRLGIDKINQVYEEALKSTLQLEQSIGIAG